MGQLLAYGLAQGVPLSVASAVTSFAVAPVAGNGKGALLDVRTNRTEGSVHLVIVLRGAAVPNAAQIKAGTDGAATQGAWKSTIVLAAIPSYGVGPSSLTQNSLYTGYCVYESLTGEFSPTRSYDFTTANTAPVLSVPIGAASSTSAATVTVSTDDPDGVLFHVTATAVSGVPADPQLVIDGKDASGTVLPANQRGSFTVSAAGAQPEFYTAGLSPNTAYRTHLVQRDLAGNVSVVASTPAFTTDATEANIATFANAGSTTGWGTFNVTLSGAAADRDGGNDAIEATCNAVGSAGFSVTSPSFTAANGVNHIRARLRNVNGVPWVRVRVVNMTAPEANTESWYNILTGVKDTAGSLVSAHSIVSEGNGWFVVSIFVNLAGTVRFGNVRFLLTSSRSVNTLTGTAAEKLRIHDLTIGS
jgi:hypothetical protein